MFYTDHLQFGLIRILNFNMKTLQESILSSTKSGKKEYIESYLEKTFPGMTREIDFEYD